MQIVVTAYHIVKGSSLCLEAHCSNQRLNIWILVTWSLNSRGHWLDLCCVVLTELRVLQHTHHVGDSLLSSLVCNPQALHSEVQISFLLNHIFPEKKKVKIQTQTNLLNTSLLKCFNNLIFQKWYSYIKHTSQVAYDRLHILSSVWLSSIWVPWVKAKVIVTTNAKQVYSSHQHLLGFYIT